MAAPVVGEAVVTGETDNEFVVRAEPVWRDKANFIVHAELGEKDRPRKFEQLWTRQIDEKQFEVCCIPSSCTTSRSATWWRPLLAETASTS